MRYVLDHGFIRLDAAMADDLSVVRAARVSFARQDQDVTDEAAAGLIGYLMSNRHGTPFEHNAFRFHVKCPLFVAREWMRHRIGSFNEWSGRYSRLEAEFYIPENVRSQVGKPGAYSFEPVADEVMALFNAALEESCEEAFRNYDWALRMGVAKEQARFFLPVGLYTQFYWTVNARSLMNFIGLRAAPQAMWEIAQYAHQVEELFAAEMPITHAAFTGCNRVAP